MYQDPELAVLRQRYLDLDKALKLKLEGDVFGSLWMEKFAQDQDSDRQDDDFDSAISKYNESYSYDETEDRAGAIPGERDPNPHLILTSKPHLFLSQRAMRSSRSAGATRTGWRLSCA